MTTPAQLPTSHLLTSLRVRAFAVATLCTLSVILTQPTQAQTFTVLHDFTGGADGASPVAGLTMAAGGNFYGTTFAGGNPGGGVVYRLARLGNDWILSPLFAFPGGYYGQYPRARVIIGPNGTLFGTTWQGGYYDNGTVFSLTPPAAACSAALCGWDNMVLYRFLGGNDGGTPEYGDLVFDGESSIYGTTSGTFNGPGTLYELTPANGGWTETVLLHFDSSSTGISPYGGVIFDQVGNLYGTTAAGGANGQGLVFELSPSGSGWTETVLYSFRGGSDGAYPYGDLIFDRAGNLYGTTTGQPNGPGSAFELSPSQGGWTFTSLHDFSTQGPVAGLTMDAAGNLYGATLGGAYGYGSIFKLTNLNGGWIYSDLYDFFGAEDGSLPYGKVLVDNNGNLFGTAEQGGAHGSGVIWEIAP
jgi:uncharacterized repeat protein (TIGR03803 family)